MKTIKCPGCGTPTTDKDFDNGTEKLAVWMDAQGTSHYECWECEHEWEEKQ